MRKLRTAARVARRDGLGPLLLAIARDVSRWYRFLVTVPLRIDPRILESTPADINTVSRRGRSYGTVVSADRLYQPWRDDPAFQDLWSTVEAHTMNDVLRTYTVYRAIEQVSHREGALIEVGTNRGGVGCLMARKAADEDIDADVFLCDTFEGIVKSGEGDGFDDGDLADASASDVRDLAATLDVEPVILEGVFPEETGGSLDAETIRFAHLDVDVYESTRDAFEFLWPKLCRGGIVVLDDYGWEYTAGVTDVVEAVADREDNVTQFLYSSQAIVVKL